MAELITLREAFRGEHCLYSSPARIFPNIIPVMIKNPKQLPLIFPGETSEGLVEDVSLEKSGLTNKLDFENRAFHDWYRFVLSFPPRLVDHYMHNFNLKNGDVLLDPFCGTGTSLVEAKLRGINSIGLEANPLAYYASRVKVSWQVEPKRLLTAAKDIAAECIATLTSQGIDDKNLSKTSIAEKNLRTLEPEALRLILADSISPLPLHKILVLRDFIDKHEECDYYHHLRLAFAKALVFSISNLRFGPEVGVGKKKNDVKVVESWLNEVSIMAHDLQLVFNQHYPESRVFQADAREIDQIIEPKSINAVFTSPPYPNEKDYTRTTRLETVLLGFIRTKQDLRDLKKGLVRSNTRGVYKADEDDKWIENYPEIFRIAEEIERRRVELGKTSGFERLYGRVTKLYFGGMARHLAGLRTVLRPGAYLGYVVGDQASYLRVMIRTGKLLAEIAQSLGYELVRIDLFRTRFATATKQDLREEVVVLRWKG
jgi:16S rRNA G966 N2-methylase RsmD